MRFAVVRNGRIRIVSSVEIDVRDGVLREIPAELDGISSARLIANCTVVEDGTFVLGRPAKAAKDLRVAFVGNWKMKCGISTYNEKLWPEVAKHVGEWKLFVERNEAPTGPMNVFGGIEVDPSRVVPCWSRGERLGELVDELRRWGPDVVWIQHEYGLWPNARHWLSMLSQLSEFRVIVTLHSVYRHLDKLVNEAAIPEIIVHQEGARVVLKDDKCVSVPVYVVPHGCDPCVDGSRLWNIYRSEQTFAQFGFGFRYKGWENSIRAVAKLKEKYPDVFFTGLFSESPYNMAEHDAYASDLARLVEELGIKDNVALIRGYQSDVSLDSYLRTNRAVVFPYVSHPAHEVFGSSGAARLAMSKGVPIVTSSVNHFTDVPSVKADSPDEIASALEGLFRSRKAWDEQVKKQLTYIEENSWENVGMCVVRILESGVPDQ